jgi:hypothetical protein
MNHAELPEHWFARELGRFGSHFSRRFGLHRMELCEDAAQTALSSDASVVVEAAR